jgi:hypothetical protein
MLLHVVAVDFILNLALFAMLGLNFYSLLLPRQVL